MKILFLIPYPSGQAPSQRFRFEQYLRLLREQGYHLKVRPLMNESTWRHLYAHGDTLSKGWGIMIGYFKRIVDVIHAANTDLVFIHREAAPLGPPIFEWIIAKVLGKRIIYDFDDAIWLPNTSEQNSFVANLKWHSKVASICKWSWK
ncbi:MAG: glycosyltransferase family 1 protein, partial [Bacteroidota bacterium]